MRLIFALLLMLALPGALHADDVDRNNAAVWYQQAIDRFNAQFTPQQREMVSAWVGDPNQPVSPELRQLISQAGSVLQDMRRGSRQEYSDFGLDRSQGAELMLPQLGQLREIGRFMKADALIRLGDGDSDGAAARIADMYRMSGHFGDDRIIISSLVGQAVFRLADSATQLAIDRGTLNAADSAKLLGAAEQLGTNDPFAYVEAVAGEQDLMAGWLAQQHEDPEKWAQTAAEFGMNADDPRIQGMLALDDTGFDKAIEEYDAVMARAVEAFANPDHEAAQAAMLQIEKEIESGEHGPLVSVLMPALSKCYETKLKGEQQIADRIAVLRQLAQGDVKPEEIANAAVWYIRAIELLNALPPETLESVRTFAGDTAAPMPETLAKSLDQAASIIDIFRDGSQKRRCDFKLLRAPDDTLALVPAYVAGMHDGLRLIHADAIRLLQSGDLPGAVDRLETSLRIAGHFGGDPIMASALAAHLDFTRTINAIETALHTGVFGDEQKPQLLEALDRIGRKDPFGYIGAVVEARSTLEGRLRQAGVPAEEFPAIQAAIKAMSAEQVLDALACFDGLKSAAAPATQPAPSAPPLPPAGGAATQPAVQASPLVRFADVLDVHAVEAYRSDLVHLAPLLAAQDWPAFIQQPAPTLCDPPIGDRMRMARADLRRARTLLAPPRAPNAPEPAEEPAIAGEK